MVSIESQGELFQVDRHRLRIRRMLDRKNFFLLLKDSVGVEEKNCSHFSKTESFCLDFLICTLFRQSSSSSFSSGASNSDVFKSNGNMALIKTR